MSMKTVPKQVARRNALLACAIVALAVVASCLVGQIKRPSASTGKFLLLARVQTPLPPPALLTFSKLSDVMQENNDHLGKIGREDSFQVAYDCGIRNFIWEPLPVNHWPTFNEILEIPLDDLTEKQSKCISMLIVLPNVAIAIASRDDLKGAVQRLTDRDPLKDWY